MELKKIYYVASVIVFLVMAVPGLRPVKVFAQGTASSVSQPAGPASSGSTEKPEEVKKEPAPAVTGMEIKRLGSGSQLYSIELRDVQLRDLFRVIAHDYNLNILLDRAVSGTITASFTNISLEEALDAIAEMSNLSIEKKKNITRIGPNFQTRNFVLKYIEAKKLLDVSAQAGSAGATSSTGLYSLLSDKGKILLGQQKNSLTVIDYPENLKKLEDYLKIIDHKMETRVFKLKYLKADEVVGATTKTSTVTQTSVPTGTQVSTTTSTSTASGLIANNTGK